MENPPAQSPHLNVIGDCWHYLESITKDLTSKNEAASFNDVQKEWNIIPMDYIHRLIESMPRRIEAVIGTAIIK